ncbi:MAG TPA: 4Fe-4S binding protein [Thermoanaerobacterales bacterium]|jgi:NADP-reducing hydrogenase subunit HndD|nr:4Fe-4S binding protein [Thermoanaerobacterales bacterium]
MKMVNLKIDNVNVSVPAGTSILDAAKEAGIKIPTLCYHPDMPFTASCRLCLVQIKGKRKLQPSCATPVKENMEVITNNPMIREARKTALELLLANHPMECPVCIKNNKCELQRLAQELNITDITFEKCSDMLPIDDQNPAIVREPNKCVKCGRCVEVCHEVQTVGAINTAYRSGEYNVCTAFQKPLAESECVFCGQCVNVCPVGAIYEKDDTQKVWDALNDPDKFVIVQTAPAIRASLGEEFGMDPGSLVTGQMVTALRNLGFDRVFDTDFTADLTIIEEGNELLERLENNGVLPMITSCSPGWINFIEKFYPELLQHLSSCKSPQQMFGALAKTYYAQKENISPEKMFVVSVMPCTAKKYEAARPEMNSSGYRDVDVVLTTRELGRMLKEAGINLAILEPGKFDEPLGISTGAGAIFGTSGGVMEAALRTVYEVVTGKELENIDFTDVRGLEGIKEAEVDIDGTKIKIAVANSLKNARELLEMVKSGKGDYKFIEVMCCPGGCIGGGGQPYGTNNETKQKRMQAIYKEDKNMKIRKSHKNPAVCELYEDFLGKPLGYKSHKLLHTYYTPKK